MRRSRLAVGLSSPLFLFLIFIFHLRARHPGRGTPIGTFDEILSDRGGNTVAPDADNSAPRSDIRNRGFKPADRYNWYNIRFECRKRAITVYYLLANK